MCRLYAQVDSRPRRFTWPLIGSPVAIARQAVDHPDGWGLVPVDDVPGIPSLGVDPAHQSEAFEFEAREFRARGLLGHVRKASVGEVRPQNLHPFEHSGWVFAHNGTVRGFEARKATFEGLLAPDLRAALRGDTDSERCFLLFLTWLRERPELPLEERAVAALARVARFTRQDDPPDAERPSVANFIATDGKRWLACKLGKELSWAARRANGADGRIGDRIERLWIASTPTHEGPHWRPIRNGSGLLLSESGRLSRFSLR